MGSWAHAWTPPPKHSCSPEQTKQGHVPTSRGTPGEVPAWCDRGLDLDERVDAGGVQAGQQRPGAIGTVTVGGRLRRWRLSIGRPCGWCRLLAVDLVDQLG